LNRKGCEIFTNPGWNVIKMRLHCDSGIKSGIKIMAKNDTSCLVGVDLGGTKMLAVVFDFDGKPLGKKKASSQSLGGAKTGMTKVCEVITKALANAGRTVEDVKGIGMACPGLVDPSAGTLRVAPNLGWRDVPVSAILQKAFGCPVTPLNDVDAGTYGEYVAGAGRDSKSLLGIFPGTGVGAGFVYDGRLIMGRRSSCMEFGLMYVPGNDLHSPNQGMVLLEDLCGRLAISAAANTAAYRGQSPILAEKAGFDVREIRSKTLATSVEAGETAVIKILENAARNLSMGIGMVINLLAPDVIVMGGGLVEDLPDIFFKQVSLQSKQFAQAPLTEGLEFRIAELGGASVALGAALYLRDRLPLMKTKRKKKSR
jgi:glucokinase